MTNSFILFQWITPPICTLSPYTAGGQNNTWRWKSFGTDVLFHFCQQLFTFMSKDLYTTVAKKVLFQFVGQMNNLTSHANGIRLFSCTEPPSNISNRCRLSERGELRARNEISFSVASLKNVHSTAVRKRFLSSWLGRVTFCLNPGWIVFMETILMMCLEKVIFLEREREIYPLNQSQSQWCLFWTPWRANRGC